MIYCALITTKTIGDVDVDFNDELQKLLDAEKTPPLDPLVEIAQAQAEALEEIRRRNADLSLQVEEIYDIIKDADENAKELKLAERRENALLGSLISTTGILDNLLEYLRRAGAEGVEPLAAQHEAALISCGLERLGFPGERLDPRLHTVISAEFNEAPLETVVQTVESGYQYRGKVIRKAAVIISKGADTL